MHTHSHFLFSQPRTRAEPSQEAFGGGGQRQSFSHVSPLNPRLNMHKALVHVHSQPSEITSANPFHSPYHPQPPTRALKAQGSARTQARPSAGPATTSSSPKVPTIQGAQSRGRLDVCWVWIVKRGCKLHTQPRLRAGGRVAVFQNRSGAQHIRTGGVGH